MCLRKLGARNPYAVLPRLHQRKLDIGSHGELLLVNPIADANAAYNFSAPGVSGIWFREELFVSAERSHRTNTSRIVIHLRNGEVLAVKDRSAAFVGPKEGLE